MKTAFLKKVQYVPERKRMRAGEYARKWNHYLEIYDNIWSKFSTPPDICEVGVDRGNSLKMYAPVSNLVLGIDHKKKMCSFPKNVVYERCCQSNSKRLAEIANSYGPFDVVIDDASHTYSLTKNTFLTLFNFVKSNGVYIIEDWASYTQSPSIFKGGKVQAKNDALLPFAKNLINELAIWGGSKERNFGESQFSKIEYYENILIITKK